MQYSPWLPHEQIASTIIILGYFVVFINFLVNLIILILLLSGRPIQKQFPRWLIIVNFLFLIPELIVFFA
jgi:hypothetical protein